MYGAIEDLDEAIRLDPKDYQYYANRAQLLHQLKSYAAEIRDLEAAMERAPARHHDELRREIAEARSLLGK